MSRIIINDDHHCSSVTLKIIDKFYEHTTNEAEIIFDNVALSIRRLRSAKRNRLSAFYTQWGNCNTPFSPANNEARH